MFAGSFGLQLTEAAESRPGTASLKASLALGSSASRKRRGGRGRALCQAAQDKDPKVVYGI